MFRKIIAGALIAMMLISLVSMAALANEEEEAFVMNTEPATPYRTQVITNTINSYIEAVWFDPGTGLGLYAGGGRDIRPDESPNTEGGSSGFEGNLGWTRAGEWVQYTVTVEEADTYRVYAYLASAAGAAGNIRVYIDNVAIGETESDDTSGWQSYQWWFAGEAELTPGQIVIGVYFINGDTNIAALRFGTEAGAIGGVAEQAVSAAAAAETAAEQAAEAADQAAGYAEGAAAGTPVAIAAAEARDAANAAAAYAATAAGYVETAQAATTLADVEAARDAARAANTAAGQQRTAANAARNQARQAAAAAAQETPADTAADSDDAVPADAGAATPAPTATDDDDNNIVLWIILAAAVVVVIVVIVIIATKKKKAA